MPQHPTENVIKQIAEQVIDTSTCQISFIGEGATSVAWQVESATDSIIVRVIPKGTNRPTTYQSEFVILHLLRLKDQPVPEPLMNSADIQDLSMPHGIEAWSITRTVQGKPIMRNALSVDIARQVGEFLSVLHSLSVSGYGRIEERSDALQGIQTDARSGIIARWCWGKLWPFDETRLAQHPLALLEPGTLELLNHVESSLSEIAALDDVVLVHTDLHGEHIFEYEGMLSGVIDFGAAFVGARAWDFAVLAHYHGWAAVEQVLIGYTNITVKRAELIQQAQKLAIVIGMYKLNRAVLANASDAKIQRIRSFVLNTLARDQKTWQS